MCVVCGRRSDSDLCDECAYERYMAEEYERYVTEELDVAYAAYMQGQYEAERPPEDQEAAS